MDKTNKTYLNLKKESIHLMNAVIHAASEEQLTSQQLHSLREMFVYLREIEIILKSNEKWEKYRNRTHKETTELIKKHKTAFWQAIKKHTRRIVE